MINSLSYELIQLLKIVNQSTGRKKYQLRLLRDGAEFYGTGYVECKRNNSLLDDSTHVLKTDISLYLDGENEPFSKHSVVEEFSDGWRPICRFFSSGEKDFSVNIKNVPDFLSLGDSVDLFLYANWSELGIQVSTTLVKCYLRKLNAKDYLIYEEVTHNMSGYYQQKTSDYFELISKDNLTADFINIEYSDGSKISLYPIKSQC